MPVDSAALADDLRAETAELERHLDALTPPDWDKPTPAVGWAIRDQISHLAYFDEAATRAALEPDAFRAEVAALRDAGDDISEGVARQARGLEPASVHAWFRSARAELLRVLPSLDPSARVPWYGPDMAVASSLTARIMETWAHGQDVIDALGSVHKPTGALRQVAHIGVRTLPNSFVTRGLEVPTAPVFVSLTAPDGAAWTWGESEAADCVVGDAVEFCLVVTQRRNIADTKLVVSGPVAQQWMDIAQAFAGPAGTGRPPTTTT
jgi:uncharacterized protein (TIGR03084 family)